MFEKIITRSFFAATFAAVALVLIHGIEAMPQSHGPAVTVVQLPTVLVTGRALGVTAAPKPVLEAADSTPSSKGPG